MRALAERLQLSPNTVGRAYTGLVGEGLVEAWAGGGSVVAYRPPVEAATPDQPGRQRLQRVARRLVAYALALGHTPGEVTHAVRAELAAFGRVEGPPTASDFAVLPALPTRPVPPPVRASATYDHLEVGGLVARATSLSHADLAQLGRMTLQQPFACDKGWVAPSLVWSGVRLADVLALAKPLKTARLVHVRAGAYAMPLSLAEVSAVLLAHRGGSSCPGSLYTNVKWVDRLEVVDAPG